MLKSSIDECVWMGKKQAQLDAGTATDASDRFLSIDRYPKIAEIIEGNREEKYSNYRNFLSPENLENFKVANSN